MPDLFTADTPRPLADRLRPQTLTEVVGQEAVTTRLAQMVAGAHLSSLILWGPPGCGKTTIARILAREAGLPFAQLSAIFAGVKDLKAVFDEARQRGGATLLFVDEIHRFMKSQQDAFLPVLEDGTIVLIGATTENPSFELNAALLSRCQTFVLHRLGPEALDALLRRAESTAEQELPLTPEARAALIAMADGDGRYALTLAEQVFAQNEALDTAALAAQNAKIRDGDMARPEAMLIAQAHTLDTLFAEMVGRSRANSREGFMHSADRYMRLALKAQGQCRTTLQPLSDIKNPRPYIQNNQAQYQQVNNATPPQAAPRAGKPFSSNELLDPLRKWPHRGDSRGESSVIQ